MCHRVIRHLYETPAAHAGLIVKTTKSATDGGVWLDLVDIVLPIWLADRTLNFDYTTFDREGNPGSKTDSKTRTIYFKIRNYFGGESTLRLFSLEHDHEVKAKLKSTRFSCLWFSELSNFYDPDVYRSSWEQLRMFHLKRYEHLWISDTNPSEEGEDSWIYRTFIRKNAELVLGKDTSAGADEFKRAIVHMPFTLNDNLAMNETEREIQAALYNDDPGEKARNYEGRWVKGHGNKGKHFSDIFSRGIHVIGGEEGESGDIDVSPNTTDLFTGWDLGSATNHAAGIMEKRIITVAGVEMSSWSILESVKHIKEQIGIKEVGLEMLGKMKHLEEIYGRTFDWTHYTDDSAINTFRPSSESFDYLEIMIATSGEIEMTGVPKPAGSVKARVQLVRRLLREKRLWVAGKCEDVIGMFENLKQGSTQADYVEWNEWKHTFDWISYVLFMECAHELALEANKPRSRVSASPSYVGL